MSGAVEKPASPTAHLTAWILMGLFAVIVVGSYVARTEIVARGRGKVIPATGIQTIQPQMDGKIVKILVTEGQTVARGDLLVTMDTAAAENDIQRIQANIARQTQEALVARAVLKPLSTLDPKNGGFVEAGSVVVNEDSDSALALVQAILTAFQDQVGQADAELRRVSGSQSTQQARLEKARADLDIVSRRFNSAEVLRKGGTISESEYLNRLREQKAIEAETLITERELSGLAAESEALERRRAAIISAALSTYRKQLSEAEFALRELQSELRAAENRLANLTLKSPVDGRIEKLSVFTVGGFVEAGAQLMLVVPSERTIEIEAFFENRDIGFLAGGQKAVVKFDAFPAERYGMIRGRVTSVGADARGDIETGKWVYAARLELDQDAIRLPGREVRFTPGMTATIDVITGERRLISYFFEPILRAVQDGFGER